MVDRGRRRAARTRGPRSLREHRGLSVALLLLVVVVVLGVIFAMQALKARSALLRAESQARQLQSAMTDGNVTAAKASLAELKTSSAEAHSDTDGFLWGAATHVPWLGDDVDAVRTASRVLDAVVSTGLDPVVNAADKMSGAAFSPRDGRVDVSAIARLAPGLARANTVLTAGRKDLQDIDPDTLIGPLSEPIANLKTKLARAQSASAAGSRASALMPPMLGSSERRRFLLAFQNNAEARARGGMPGAFAVLEADQGRIRIIRQGTAGDFGRFDKPVIGLTEDEKGLYSTMMASLWSDTGLTPDFPRTAQIMRAMYEKKFGGSIDGVISVDPIALAYVLDATGPVSLADGTQLSAGNAVSVLLNTVYLKLAPDQQDQFYADAARRVFTAVIGGKGTPVAMIQQLARAAGENRILIASSRPDEQKILAPTRVAGALMRTKSATPSVGLFVNDSTGAKLEYYLRRRTTVKAVRCREDQSQELTTTTRLTSVAPKDAASLPPSILGVGEGAKQGAMRMNLRYYAPLGGTVTSMSVGGKDTTVNRARHLGHDVAIVSVLLRPGQTVTVTTRINTGPHQPLDAVFSTTPGIEATPNNVRVASACA